MAPKALRTIGSSIALGLALALVVASERRAFPLGLLMRPESEALVPVVAVVAAAVALGMVIRHRRRVPAPAAALAGLALAFALVAHLDNRRYLAGDSLAPLLGFASLVGWALAWASSRWEAARSLVPAGALLGATYLGATGLLLYVAAVPRGVWFELKNAHTLAGLYLAPLFALFLFRHIQLRNAGAPVHRLLGFAASVAGVGLLMTGINRAATGGGHFAFGATGWHRLCALACAAVATAHVLLALRGRGAPRSPRSQLPALAALVGVALALAEASAPRSATVARGEYAWGADARRTLLGNPRTGVIASTVHGSGIPRALLSPEARAPGCNNNVSCHQGEVEGWSRSSHRFAANPAYRRVVGELVREEGIASARLCASCHDPLPLLAGEMVPGAGYPQGPSEGVTCLVCHAAREAPGAEPGDGRFRLAVQPSLPRLFAVPALGTMMVYDHMEEHLAMVRGEHLRRDAMCMACHNLQVDGVPLRRTGAEFEALGLLTEAGDRQTCRSCHMPASGRHDDAERHPHDHAMLGTNFGVATLAGDTRAERVAFVAEALELRAAVDPGPGPPALRVELVNRGGGHGFPTAPLDLVQWWFELRPASATEAAWRRAGPERLFEERLLDRSGATLRRHELWRVHATSFVGERIARGESRTWRIALPEPPLPRGERWLLRLRSQRFPAALAPELRGSGMLLDPVEVLRREVPPG